MSESTRVYTLYIIIELTPMFFTTDLIKIKIKTVYSYFYRLEKAQSYYAPINVKPNRARRGYRYSGDLTTNRFKSPCAPLSPGDTFSVKSTLTSHHDTIIL